MSTLDICVKPSRLWDAETLGSLAAVQWARGVQVSPLCFYCKYQALFPLHLLLSETLGLSTAIVIIVISFDKKVGQCKEENRECRRILQEQGRVEDTWAGGGKRAGHSRMRS